MQSICWKSLSSPSRALRLKKNREDALFKSDRSLLCTFYIRQVEPLELALGVNIASSLDTVALNHPNA